MAADFNAGSIEGTLDIDSTPFAAGLARAKQQAEDFEHRGITPEVGLKDDEFKAKKAVATAELDKFDHKKVDAKADLDISSVLAKFALLNKLLDAGGLGRGVAGFGLMTGKVFALGGALLSVLSILGPVTGALGGLGVAGMVALGGIVPAMGLFAAATAGAMKVLTTANKAGTDLTGWAGKAQDSLKGLTSAWHDLISTGVQGKVFQFLSDVFDHIAAVLPKLAPLLSATVTGMQNFVDAIFKITNTPVFDHFIKTLSSFMTGFLSGAGPAIEHFLSGFMHIFIALQPLMAVVGHGIAMAAQEFDAFSKSMEQGGITPWIHYVVHWLPLVFGLFGSVFTGIRNLLAGLTPLAGPAIHFIQSLVDAIGKLDIGPLARGLGAVLTAAEPLLGVLGHLLNVILVPLGHFLREFASTTITPLATSLNSGLHPAFKALRTILSALVDPLAAFAGSIANLANPTGVHLVSTLLTSLSGIVVKLAPHIGALLVAIEGLIDRGIEVLTPMIPTVTKVLSGLADAAVIVADGLTKILDNKAAVGVLLALVGAVTAYKVAVATVTAVQKAWAATTTIIEAVQFGWAGLTVAQDANTASILANKVGMIAWRVWTLASAAATNILAGATAVLTAVMDANPIMLVVIALAALAAGLIYAYKHSEKFRELVINAFHAVQHAVGTVLTWLGQRVQDTVDFIQKHWRALLIILTGPIGAAIVVIHDHWNQIVSWTSGMIHSISDTISHGIDNVVGFFKSIPDRLHALRQDMLDAGKSLMGSIFEGLESAASAVGGFAANIATAIWHELEDVLNNVLPHSLSINKGPIHITVPLFPMLAAGGVTDGMTSFVAGDNPGGREAVIPLDKYDIPKKGQTDQATHQAQQDNSKIIGLLSTIARSLADSMPEDVASALGDVLSNQSDANLRRQLQLGRAL